ncbi:MAG: Wzz/FepE/Etk N-terminal domain-containing protein [Motiliproteus sp.]
MNHPRSNIEVQTAAVMDDDEIDLLELWRALWQGKLLIIALTALFTVAAVVIALQMTNIYRAEALLAPVDEKQGGLSAMANQFGGLAALAGVNLGSTGGKTATAIATLKSRAFIDSVIQKHQLLVPLVAGTWSKELGRSVIDPELYDEATQTWVRKVSGPKQSKPSAWEAYKAFKEILSVSEDKNSGLVTVAIEWPDASQAQRWVSWLVEDINHHFKQQDVAEAERSIRYLEQQLEQTPLVAMQQVFYQLIESQTKTQMLANARDEYIFQVIDPAVVAEEKIKPKRALIVVLGTLLGGMLSVFVVLIRYFVKKRQ